MDFYLRRLRREAHNQNTTEAWQRYASALERTFHGSLDCSEGCSEFITEENLNQNPEPCVPGDWHCELPKGHSGLHQYTHTMQWEALASDHIDNWDLDRLDLNSDPWAGYPD